MFHEVVCLTRIPQSEDVVRKNLRRMIVIYGCIDMADFQHVYLRIFYALLLNPSMSAQKSPKAHRQSL